MIELLLGMLGFLIIVSYFDYKGAVPNTFIALAGIVASVYLILNLATYTNIDLIMIGIFVVTILLSVKLGWAGAADIILLLPIVIYPFLTALTFGLTFLFILAYDLTVAARFGPTKIGDIYVPAIPIFTGIFILLLVFAPEFIELPHTCDIDTTGEIVYTNCSKIVYANIGYGPRQTEFNYTLNTTNTTIIK